MNNGATACSCVLAAVAGACFAGGIIILTGGRVENHGENGVCHIHAR